MARKQLALLVASLGIATPGHAFDTRNDAQTVMFYYAIPLDAQSKKETQSVDGHADTTASATTRATAWTLPLYTFNLAREAAQPRPTCSDRRGRRRRGGGRRLKGKSSQQQVQQQQQTSQPHAGGAASRQGDSPAPCPELPVDRAR